MPVQIRRADADDLPELAAVAAAAFPLACPPSSTPENIADFIAGNLTEKHFAEYLDDPARAVFVAVNGRILGYTMLIRGVPDDVAGAVPLRPAVELSKCYVLADAHGTGAATALMTATLDYASAEARCVWLGVNQENQRAQRFYGKHGFVVAGTRTFRLGSGVEHDYVMVRPLP
ncbi:N-acetyltransferase [Mycobacterium sp. OTB74]|jgi:ribosomal protein S18 acetylase RimI-like enzyme|uniref:GNAT family N-acetyltransferase n=1 Tax=Mycobacterium sp. OTB74 TaxID=1853452 RepID=UPI002473683D|nr:N-acetyltransferase [Mycobacterium sp. OTB74]